MEAHFFQYLAILISIIISAFASGSETAITGASQATIHKLKVEGNKRAKIVSSLREDKEKLISVLLIINSLCNVVSSSLATAIGIEAFGSEGAVYAAFFMALIIIFFAEVLPKTYAFENPERFSLIVAPTILFSIKLFYPLITIVQLLASRALKMLGARKDGKNSVLSPTDELRGAIDLHHHEGSVIKDHKDMLGSILDLGDTEVGEIMIHRTKIFTLDINLEKKELVRKALASNHTRIPLWEHDADNIVGVLNIKDLIRAVNINSTDFIEEIDIKSILSEPWYIPETTLLSEQLKEFRARRNHFALVIDEYGAIKGLVTLEDILEEIVGQIQDEHDVEHNMIVAQKDGSYILEGTTTIRDVNRDLDWNLPDTDASTIAGLIMHETEKIPEEGDEFTMFKTYFKILKKNPNQTFSIKVYKIDTEDQE